MPENRSVALGRRSKLTKQLIERICEQVEAATTSGPPVETWVFPKAPSMLCAKRENLDLEGFI
jgi:hypothetical protein